MENITPQSLPQNDRKYPEKGTVNHTERGDIIVNPHQTTELFVISQNVMVVLMFGGVTFIVLVFALIESVYAIESVGRWIITHWIAFSVGALGITSCCLLVYTVAKPFVDALNRKVKDYTFSQPNKPQNDDFV